MIVAGLVGAVVGGVILQKTGKYRYVITIYKCFAVWQYITRSLEFLEFSIKSSYIAVAVDNYDVIQANYKIEEEEAMGL